MELGRSNAASEFSQQALELMNDRKTAMSPALRTIVAPTFRRIDRRRIAALPDVDLDGYLESLIAIEEIVGEWPTHHIDEIVGES